MSTQLIDELNGRIKQHLSTNTTLTLSSDVVGTPNFSELLQELCSVSAIVIEQPVVVLEEQLLSITGNTTLLSADSVPVKIELQDISNNLQIKIIWQEALTLANVGSKLFSGAFSVPEQFKSFSLSLVEFSTAGDLSLGGTLPSVDVLSLVQELVGSKLRIPSDFPAIVAPESIFIIQPVGDSVRFLLAGANADFGAMHLLIVEVAGAWEAVVVFSLPENWRFSNLAGVLAPLDVLKVARPTLTLASFDEPTLMLPDIDGPDLQLAVKQGLGLSGDLVLKGVGLDLIDQLIGQNQLPLQLTVGDSFATTSVRANFDQKIDILPSILVFEDLAIEITPNPFALALVCRALVSIADEQLPDFRVNTAITDAGIRLLVQTDEVWREPFGISNLTINKLVFQMETAPEPKYAVLGDIMVSDKTIRAAVELAGSFPSMIFGELVGTLSAAEVVRDLVGLSLPTGLIDISISDFMIRVVGDPLGVTIGDEHFKPGLALQGTLGFFGIEMFVKVDVDPNSHVFAQGSLSEIVHIGNLLTISNAQGDGPPTATLDTSHSPFLILSGRYELLGLVGQSTEVEVNDAGIRFEFAEKLGPAQYILSGRAKALNDFSVEGTFSFGIKEPIGPIRVASGLNMGSLSIDIGFDGTIFMSLVRDEFNATISGGFHFQGINPTIKIPLNVTPDSLEEFPQLVVKHIIDNAEDIFAEFLQDADKWLLGIRDGIVKGVGDVAQVLKQEFNRSAAQIGRDIRNTLNRGPAAAAEGLQEIGESAERIAGILKDLGDSPDVVKDALQRAGFPADAISKALQVSFGIPHVDFPARGHMDTPLTPHIDTPLTPHGDIKARAHADTPVIPHADRKKQGHGDVPRKGHMDFPAQDPVDGWIQHTDFKRLGLHGDFGVHGDIALTPHGDTKLTPHVDTPVIPHLDTPKQGHVDVKARLHVDFPRKVHVDVPRKGHIDSPAVPHGDVPRKGRIGLPAVPHGDVP